MAQEEVTTPLSTKSDVSSLGLGSPSVDMAEEEIVSPNDYKYYQNNFDKAQFNVTLINCAIYLIKLLYGKHTNTVINGPNLRFFILQILKRSKTSIQVLQVASFYLLKLIKKEECDLPENPKHLFLGVIILAAKFSQDANYSFKTWIKICGLKDDTDSLKILKSLEIKLLNNLDYNLYISHHTYENWCNVLFIFGYDFIKVQRILTFASKSEIVWETEACNIKTKLDKWHGFFDHLNLAYLNSVEIKFITYYLGQFNSKVFIVNSLFNKRKLDEGECSNSKVMCK